MITGFYCTNVFSEHAKELIDFYREVLEIPVIKTDADDSNGVYFGFIENAPLFVYGIVKYLMRSRRDINPLFFKQIILN